MRTTHIVDAVIRHPSSIALSPLRAVVSITLHPRRRPGHDSQYRQIRPERSRKGGFDKCEKPVRISTSTPLGSLKKPLVISSSFVGVFCCLAFGFGRQNSRSATRYRPPSGNDSSAPEFPRAWAVLNRQTGPRRSHQCTGNPKHNHQYANPRGCPGQARLFSPLSSCGSPCALSGRPGIGARWW